jgi:hypothetical protein
MSSRGIMLRDVCDAICQDATLVDNAIVEQIKVVRQLLPKEKGVLLNRLLDGINDADSEAKYEAFEKGFLLGLLLAA